MGRELTASPVATGRRVVPVMSLAVAFGLSACLAVAAEPASKVKIFGHLSQAYGRSDRGSIQSATESGTTDLGNIAVQLRWEISPRDTAVIQLSHERRADDIFSPQQDELEIDWAFYQRRIGENTTIKVGRLNVPLGIYNEIRDVGTLLPFFNLPISFYAGVLSSAETVDGIAVSHTFAARSDWDLEADFYYGGWDTVQQQLSPEVDFGLRNLDARAEDGLGVQLWLNTPIHGLRLGAGGLTWLLDGPLSPAGTKERWDSYHLSLDLAVDRWMLRSEFRRWRFEQDFGGFLNLGSSLPAIAEREGFYVQAGVWVTPKIGLFGQFEAATLDNDLGLPPEGDFHEDLGLSVTYRFRHDLVARVEYHRSDTRFPLDEAGPAPRAVEVGWLIAALSVSF